jgi:class 3 adenylate cyclase
MSPQPKYKLRLFGRFELSGPDGTIELPNKKLAGLLAFLACSAPEPQSREKLATLLWGSHFDAQARQNLRQALFRLRRALGPGALIGDGDEISLARGVVDCDATRLKALSRDGSAASLAAAADLYEDSLLSDVNIAEEAWADWLSAERLKLEGVALDAMIRDAEHELSSGNAESALKAANRAIAVNALREDAHRLVVRALAATGRRAEALKHYQDLAVLFKRELNSEPDEATRALVTELRDTPSPSRSPTVGETSDRAAPAASEKSLLASSDRRSGALEQRQLTIMVCNLAGSTPLPTSLDAEEVHDLIAAFHKAVGDTAAQFDGSVAQYLSDGAVVYFGYPAAHEHDAEQAVRAGFAILGVVGTMKAATDAGLHGRIGIATGRVVVSQQFGTGDTRQHVAIGETPILAARLQAIAAPSEIVIADSTRRLVGQLFDCRPLDPVEVKGLTQPIEAWRVIGETAGVSRFDARRTGKLSPLVGRQEELDLLLRRWQQAKHGEGRVVLLSGEPGIGKSRLAESLVTALEGEPYARLRYFCSPHHVNSPLHPVITQLELAARLEPGSDFGARLERLEATFNPTSKNPSRDVALIAELLGMSPQGRFRAVQASPQQKREMLLAALLDQIDGLAAQGPVLIVLEDAHWIDPTSLDLAERMVTRAANRPVLLVVTFRQELQPAWSDLPHVTMLPLNRLGLRDSAVIVRGIARNKAVPDAIVDQIFAATDGVPLYTEELTATLLESGLLRETANSYVLDHPRSGLAMPTTLQGSLVARLDRLGPGKNVAMIGAAIGRQFSHELVGAVSALPAAALEAALDRLAGSGLLSRRGTPPDATYRFKHALVRDAAYGTMLTSRRRQLHSSIAKALVERFTTLAESQPEVIARHFTEAGLASEAVDYWLKAGRLAGARSANREAIASFEQAVQLLETLPETGETLQRGVDVRFDLKDALVSLGEFERIIPHLHEAERLARLLNDQTRLGQIYVSLCHYHWMTGRLAESYRSGQKALAIADALGDVPLQLETASQLGAACVWQGNYRQAEGIFLGALERFAGLEDGEHASPTRSRVATDPYLARSRVATHSYLTLILSAQGRFKEGAVHGQEGIRLAEMTDRPHVLANACVYAAGLESAQGNFSRAIALAERAQTLCSQWNIAMLKESARGNVGYARARMGRLTEGIAMLEQAVSAFITMRHGVAVPLFLLHLGEAYLLADRRADAFECARHALTAAREGRQRGHEARAIWLFGEIAAGEDCFGQAEGHYQDALALAEKLGFRLQVAHCHLGLGKLYRRMGKHDQASKHLVTATTMYHAMDMLFWVEQAEVEMQQLRPYAA